MPVKQLALLLGLALLAGARSAGAECTAAQVMACGPNCWTCVGNTCTIAKLLTVTPPSSGVPCTFDFGARDIVLASGGFTAGANTFEIRAHGLTVGNTGVLKATGNQVTSGGVITLTLGAGGFHVLSSANLIDLTGGTVTGTGGMGGTFTVVSDGDITLDGLGIVVDGTTPLATGGTINLTAGRRLLNGTAVASSNLAVSAGLSAQAKVNGVGGTILLTAAGDPPKGKIDIEDRIDVTSGGGNGLVCATSDGDTILGITPTGGPTLVADGNGDGTCGGEIDVCAGGSIGGSGAASGRLVARGSNAFVTLNGGGAGGTVSLQSSGPLTLAGGSSGGIDVSGGLGGCGGFVCLASLDVGADVTLTAPIAAGTSGVQGFGGEVDVCSGARTLMQSDIDTSAVAGCATVCVNAGTDIMLSPPTQSILADGVQGSIGLCAGGQVTLSGPELSASSASTQPFSSAGFVSVAATGSVTASGPVHASAAGANAGGQIEMIAGKDLSVTAAALLDADGGRTGGVGGSISLTAGDPDFPGNLTLSGPAHAIGTSPAATLSASTARLDACNIHLTPTALLDTHGDTLASNALTARTGITVDAGAQVITTGVSPMSRNVLVLPTGAPTPSPAAFTPPLAPGDVQFRPPCTAANTPLGCLIPCPVCGNGVQEYPETCDNGAANGVCQPCSSLCRTFTCNDNNACTTDSCDPSTGMCMNVDTITPTCDDHNVCTNERCNPTTGLCETTFVRNCDDANPCTTDACDPVAGCVNTPIAGCTTTTTTFQTGTSTTTSTTSTTGASTTTTSTSTTSPITTTTSTTTASTTTSAAPSTSTTSTTVPPECTPDAPAACDDADLCTQDACVDGHCVHQSLVSFGAVLCRLDGITAALQGAPASAVGGNRPQHKLAATILKARNFTTAAQGVQGKRRVKQLGKAGRKIVAFVRAVQKGMRAHKIEPVLGSKLLSLASSAMSELTPLRTGS